LKAELRDYDDIFRPRAPLELTRPEWEASDTEKRLGYPLAWVCHPSLRPKMHTVQHVCRVLSISRKMFWKLVRDRRLVVAKIGSQTLVSDLRLRWFLDSLEGSPA
jgi:hypothetical protein